MISVTDEQFDEILGRAIDKLHKQMQDAKNVAIVTADEPTPEQREKLQLRGNQTLFGLYEGTPLPQRHGGDGMGVIPDKITVFKNPLCMYAHDMRELEKEVHHTLWHELAHHFGLGHGQIHDRENGDEH